MSKDDPQGARLEISTALQCLPAAHRALIEQLYGLGGKRCLSRKRLALQMGVPLVQLNVLHDEALRMLRRGSPTRIGHMIPGTRGYMAR